MVRPNQVLLLWQCHAHHATACLLHVTVKVTATVLSVTILLPTILPYAL